MFTVLVRRVGILISALYSYTQIIAELLNLGFLIMQKQKEGLIVLRKYVNMIWKWLSFAYNFREWVN